ncbi:Ig-like domain repeat protein [Corynebacterium freneyi]|uniref:Ig-like domain repeat protein n=1 Tax=Corynebacterium freneyi TaxID=134034 RepID=UPI00254F837E|nr:Ig-like domain repeat protein [Corynebacterium freneyi]MDK8768930.1 Ig-like domain repeat protein [Corynebacterium freneyi]
MRKFTAFASAAAVAVAGFVVLPMAIADEVTNTASMSLTCKATPSTSLVGPQVFSADDVSVNVTSPEDVEIGEDFSTTFTIDPVSVAVPSLPLGAQLRTASRLKLDFALPEGVDFVGADIDESNANLQGMRVLRVNESGYEDPNGRILRLTSANNDTIGNGPNSSKNSHAGIRYNITGSTIDLRFPVIKLNMRADTEGDKNFGVRTAGNAGNYGADENFLTMLGDVRALGSTIWAPVQCSPRASESAPIDARASQLTTVKVNPKPAAVDTSMSLGGVSDAVAGTPVELTAAIEPADAAGTVVFSSGEHVSEPVEVVDGRATGELTFPEAGEYQVTAAFTPANAEAHTASSTTGTVTVAGRSANLAVTAAESAPARGHVEATATVEPGATGTVAFRIGEGAEVTADVDAATGTATASVPTGTAVGAQTLTAEYRPTTGSPFAPAKATTDVEVTAITETSLELSGVEQPVHPGETVTLSAEVIPAENTENAAGQVIFTIEGRDIPADVADNRAAIEVIPDRGGEFPVKARFVPADNTQTPAEAEGTLRVIAAGDTAITAQAPTDVEPMVEAPTTVTIDPAAAGTVTATIDGRKITAEVNPEDGTATLPLVFPREGDYTVPVEFTPADPRTAKAARTTIDVTVAAPTYDSVSVAFTNEPKGTIGEKHVFRADVTPNAGDKSNVSGFLTLKSNSEKVMKDGAEVRIPVVRGIADFDMVWPTPGVKTLEGTFVGTEGKDLGTGTATVTITDENGEIPPTDGDADENPDTGGDLPSTPGTGSSDIKSFFERLWKFIVDLFTGKLTPGSLGSSDGAPAGSSDRPSADDVTPSQPEHPAEETEAPAADAADDAAETAPSDTESATTAN